MKRNQVRLAVGLLAVSLASMAMWRPALAQCTPWGCQPPGYQQPFERPWPFEAPKAQPKYGSTPPSKAVCRVWVPLGAGQNAGGTGVAISGGENWTAVLTCAHVVGRQGVAVQAKFPTGLVLSGKATAVSQECDAAIVTLDGKAPQLAYLATEPPAIGTAVYAGGYDGLGDPWRHWQGRILRTSTRGDYIISGGARSGDSGGPVWTEDGLVGIIWGTDGRETTCTSLPQLAVFFTSNRYVFPWNAWLADRKDARDHGQTLPPQPMPRAPRPLPESPPQSKPPAESIPIVPVIPEEIKQRLAALENRLQALEARVATIEPTVHALQKQNGHAVEKAQEAIAAAQAARQQAQGALGAAQEAKEHASNALELALERAKEYLKGWLPTVLGLPVGVTVVLVGLVFWLVRRDIRSRIATGDPLEAERVLQAIARRTPTPVDDWLVDRLSQALDRVMPRPQAAQPAAAPAEDPEPAMAPKQPAARGGRR